jgi:hypothetical protein
MSKSTWLIAFALMLSMLRGAMAQDHYAVLIGVETYDTSTLKNL